MTLLAILFWLSCALIVWTQVGYRLALGVAARLRGRAPRASTPASSRELPALSLIVAAHDEQEVIAAKVTNALALDYPRELLEVIVACDGCADETAARARGAGADLVLELPRGGKIRAQDAAVAQARGEILAFSDANACGTPTRRGSWWARSRTARSVMPAARSRSPPPTGPPTRRACTGATSWGCVSWSRGCRRSRPGTARSTPPAATATSSWTRSWATTCRSPSTPSRRACAPSTSPPPWPARRWCPQSRASSSASAG